MKVTIELGPDLQLEYQSWLDVKESLGIDRSINNFLYYTYNYGTFADPKNPDENEEVLVTFQILNRLKTKHSSMTSMKRN